LALTKASIERDTAQDFQKVPGANLRAYFNITQLAVKRMLMQYWWRERNLCDQRNGGSSYSEQ
jgi:hypothetical protein